MRLRLVGIGIAAIAATGCLAESGAFMQGYAQGRYGVAGLQASGPPLLIYGGQSHDVFLGCLNCAETDPSSVTNQYGRYGSQFSADSLRNQFSRFGNQYNAGSPCNQYATSPPVIVDQQGKYFGEFTLNTARPRQIKEPWVIARLALLCVRQ